jgi:hypothetical protein
MNDSLATYLHDHLAGSALAIDLVEAMCSKYSGEPLGKFAESLLVEIKADRAVLQGICDRVGSGSNRLKEWSAWATEKLSRLKLGSNPESFGAFEALEFLELGVYGKSLLWQSLSTIAIEEKVLSGIDFEELIARAQTQREQLEAHRLATARAALVPVEQHSEKS